MLPSFSRFADQALVSLSLKKQWGSFFRGCAGAADAWFDVSLDCPHAASAAAAATISKVLRIVPSRSAGIEPKGGESIKRKPHSADRLAAFLLLKQVRDDVAARREAHLIALDLGDEPARDEV